VQLCSQVRTWKVMHVGCLDFFRLREEARKNQHNISTSTVTGGLEHISDKEDKEETYCCVQEVHEHFNMLYRIYAE
jgi:hypothetical protein